MKAYDLAYIAVNRSSSPFFLRANQCVVRNVSWGLFNWGEADLIACSKAGYLTEGEVKISKADLLNDQKKEKFNQNRGYYKSWRKSIKHFYYIVPKSLVEEALKLDAGVISIDGDHLKVERKAEYNKEAEKLGEEELYNLMRLGCMKAWRKE